MKIVFWTNYPSPYMVVRFNEYARTGSHDLEVWFNHREFHRHRWNLDESTWKFEFRYLDSGILPVAWAAPAAFLAARPRLLVSLYSGVEFAFTGTLAAIFGTKVGYWYERTFDHVTRRSNWKELLKRMLFRASTFILVPGPDAAASASRYVDSDAKVRTIHHCVDPRAYPEGQRLDPTSVARRFLYVGLLDDRVKGVGDLIDAFARVKVRLPSASLTLVGDGPDSELLQAKARTIGDGSVIFAGFVQPRDLLPWYESADVFVFPSHGDTYGMVVDEAMYAGLAVISTRNVGEIGLRVVDGISGMLVESGDVDGLAAAMLTVATSVGLASRLAAAGRALIGTYSPNRWVEEMDAVADEIGRR